MNLKDRQVRNILILFGISLTYWLFLVFYREFLNQDILMLRKNIIFGCNGWCLSHFLHYLFLGYMAPKYWLYIILIGMLFEIIEIPLNKLSKYIDSKIILDSLTNTLGVITGLILYKILPNKIDLYNLFRNK